MRIEILERNGRILARSAAILIVGALSAGCSSSAMRFDDFTDGILTGSTANQRQIIDKAENQPFPGDLTVAPVNGVTQLPAPTGALARTAGGGVQRTALPAPTAPAAASVPAPDMASAGATARIAQPDAAGTRITVRPGETVSQLSTRFGVSGEAIMRANGISDPTRLAAGQAIVIPGYQANAAGTGGAPASPVRGTPAQDVAVLPQAPKVREPEAGAATAARADARSGASYTVVAGDTLFGIAQKTGASAEAIKSANGLSNGFIRIGQVLTIPGSNVAQQVATASTGKVDPASTGGTVRADAPQPAAAEAEPAAYTPPVSKERLVEQVALNPSEAAPDATGIDRMRWPVRGRVISAFGSSVAGKRNDGIDIAVPEGTPVKAAENGVVIYAGDGLKEFGNTVLVRHEDGLVTVYGHASEITVARGDTVRRGQELARSGMSGSAETPQLHFEVRKDSSPVDPITFLE